MADMNAQDVAASDAARDHLKWIKSQTNDANQIGAAQSNLDRANARLSPASKPADTAGPLEQLSDWVNGK